MRTSVDVHNRLVERDVPHELVPLRGRIRNPEHIPGVLGLPPAQVGRVVLLEGGGEVVAALVAADREADPEAVSRVIGLPDLEPVEPARAADVTGFLYEALPPVGLPDHVPVVIDAPLAGEEVLYFAGGETSSVLKIRASDLVAASEGGVAPISRPA